MKKEILYHTILFFFLLIMYRPVLGQSTSSYALLTGKPDDGYYLVGSDDVLRFKFIEEYKVNPSSNQLNLAVYNSEHEKKSVPSVTYKYGENLIQLNVSSLPSNEYYILEVYNQKNEKMYLRFKTQ